MPAGQALLSDPSTGVEENPAGDEPPAKRPSGRRRLRLVVMVLVALVLALVLRDQLLDRGRVVHGSDGGGPLTAGSGRLGVSFPVALGRPFTFGSISLHNEGERPLELRAIRLRPPLPAGFELVDVLVAQDRDRELNSVGTSRTFPPPEDEMGRLRPLEGLMIPNYEENERWSSAVLMGLQLDRPGKATFTQVEIDYRVGSRDYTMQADVRFMACGPHADFPDGCKAGDFFTAD